MYSARRAKPRPMDHIYPLKEKDYSPHHSYRYNSNHTTPRKMSRMGGEKENYEDNHYKPTPLQYDNYSQSPLKQSMKLYDMPIQPVRSRYTPHKEKYTYQQGKSTKMSTQRPFYGQEQRKSIRVMNLSPTPKKQQHEPIYLYQKSEKVKHNIDKLNRMTPRKSSYCQPQYYTQRKEMEPVSRRINFERQEPTRTIPTEREANIHNITQLSRKISDRLRGIIQRHGN